jgi:putative ABC transport system permease protein
MRDDLKTAWRSLTSGGTITIAALAVLTLGIGVSTAIFSVVDAVVLRGLPFDEHDRLVAVGARLAPVDPRDPDALLPVAPQNYLDWAAQQRTFAPMAAVASGWLTLQEPGGEPESLVPQRVTANFFDVLRVRPAIGRAFSADHEVEGRQRVVVLANGLWRRRFGADPGIIGRAIRLQDLEGDVGAYEVVGVMPAGFTYPVGAARSTDVWIPYVVPANQRVRAASRTNSLQVIARLAPGVSLWQAQQQMTAIAGGLERANPQWNKDDRIGVRPLVDHVVGSKMRSWLMMLLGAVGVLLLIACANAANLLLARFTSRAREVSIRAALGANRGRLVREFILESLLLFGIAGACGVIVGWWTLGALKSALPPGVPRVAKIALDLRVLAAAAAAACATGLLFGAAPALQSSKTDLVEALRDGGNVTAGRGRRRLRSALVIGEVALAVVLLVGAALFIGSFVSLVRIEPGFNPDHVLTAQLTPRVERLPGGKLADRSAALIEAADRIRQVPGVSAAAFVDGGLPFGGATSMTSVFTAGGVEMLNVRSVTPDYLRALRIPLRAGRFFTPKDDANAAEVVVLNASAARHFFPGLDPLGRVIGVAGDRTVVGVVDDIHQRSLEMEPWKEAYVPMAQRSVTGVEMAIRTEGDPLSLLPAIKAAALSVFPDVPLRNIAPMRELLNRQMAQRKLNMLLLGLFGLLGLVIAAVGVYAVIAQTVAQRTREIGIRMALGATRAGVVSMVLREACLLIGCGLAAGAASAWCLRGVANSFLFGVRATDPRAFAAGIAVLAASALLASLLPARRASRVDPVVTLKT